MRVYKEVNAQDFDFWAGAKDTVKYLTNEEIDTIFDLLEESSGEEGMSETAVNDFFWFEEDTIAEWLGYESFEEIMERDEE